MAPMNTLTGLVMLAAVTRDLAGAAPVKTVRSLQEGVLDTEFTVDSPTGEEFIVDIKLEDSTTPIEILVPPTEEVKEETLVGFDGEGHLTEVIVGDVSFTVTYTEDGEVEAVVEEGERRERSRRATTESRGRAGKRNLQTENEICRDECQFAATAICDTLDDICFGNNPLFANVQELFEDNQLCDALTFLCTDTGIQANCANTCAVECDPSFPVEDECDTGEICCPVQNICEIPQTTGACGDPHMTGFLGQNFDFAGADDSWYCLIEDGPSMHLNMRVNAPVASLPEVTYITGLTVGTVDFDGAHHTIEVEVTDPHSLESSCAAGASPCLAEGALTVKLDGKEALAAPGTVNLGPGVAVSAVNLPGACRSFGFEQYWHLKQLQNAAAGRRRLNAVDTLVDMGEWILNDPTATNMEECIQYVDESNDLFAHDSEHASFQIMTPLGTVRLTHGRLHQVAIRDPTDSFDIPDHRTWQMNVALDHHDVSLEATGVLGETTTPTYDNAGRPIMKGLKAIRGSQEDYRVAGPLETVFVQNHK